MSRVNGFQLHYTTTLQHHLMVLRSVLRSPVFHRCNHIRILIKFSSLSHKFFRTMMCSFESFAHTIRHVTGSTELLTQMKDKDRNCLLYFEVATFSLSTVRPKILNFLCESSFFCL
ncbi:uncharacterized protein ACN2A1_000530 isoform 2-T3 [Glossina fuscipes fuscipes]